jgi:RND superfamily putative drug exporter
MTAATAPLPDGLDRLGDGADRLARGLQRLSSGTGRLADGLGRGAERTSDLRRGLDRAHDRTSDAAQDTAEGRQLADVRDRSPRLLRSGYFVLAALDGSRPGARTQASYGVSLDRGGQSARITVIPDSGPNDAGTRELRDRLESEMPRLAAATRAQAHVGGVAAQITDYREALGNRLPILVIVLSFVTALMLVVVLRAIVLPLISVALNLLTVGAAFGIVALLFQGAEPALGGPGWADILSLLGTFTIVFGLSLDYQVFILTRMREAWDERNDLDHAITHAIAKTGRVVTGAAAIMGGVFIAFTFSDLTIIKQTGVGLAVAVLIDATLVRLVLLPAAMRLAGRATFWLPGWLDRLLPTVDLEGARR